MSTKVVAKFILAGDDVDSDTLRKMLDAMLWGPFGYEFTIREVVTETHESWCPALLDGKCTCEPD